MGSEPTTTSARAAKRKKLLDGELHAARIYGNSRNRSMKCRHDQAGFGLPRHAGEPDGCKNDGTGCLCECHDPEPSP
jgi:hypothetical protein